MPVQSAKPAPPSDDKRWKMIGATMRRNGYEGHALIETLHSVQDAFGYLEEPAMEWVADSLNLPLSKVYGVATFYHLFTLKPQGKHTCVICTGTACYIKGADNIVDELLNRYKVKPGETTKDNKLSVLSARCVGACGLAPAAVLNGQMLANQSPEDLVSKIEDLS